MIVQTNNLNYLIKKAMLEPGINHIFLQLMVKRLRVRIHIQRMIKFKLQRQKTVSLMKKINQVILLRTIDRPTLYK